MLKSEIAVPLQIELRLVPGLPGIRFLGLPDTGLKESEIRIRSALRASGYQIPKGRLLLVDILPRDEKKHGRGLDLPVAIGFLLLTNQIDFPNWEENIFYGDIGLSGQVTAPKDWNRAALFSGSNLVTGAPQTFFEEGDSDENLSFSKHAGRVQAVRHLSPFRLEEVPSFDLIENKSNLESEKKKFFALNSHLRFNRQVSRFAALAAAGEHPTLLCGPQGSGKSTLARAIHFLRPEANALEKREFEIWSGREERPIFEPHHSASVISMVGGSAPVRPGIATKAHRGSILMDELLLFKPEVQESLREPLETGQICLTRGTENRTLPADFLLLGTANLCACGRWTPDQPDLCNCPSRVRSLYEGKLRGPFVDRFQILLFTSSWKPAVGDFTLESIENEVKLAIEFQAQQGRRGNRRWNPTEKELKNLNQIPATGSERRRLALLRVARTLADLEQRESIEQKDLHFAASIAIDTFQALHADSR